MATIQTNPLPKAYTAPDAAVSQLSSFKKRRLLPAGPAFIEHLRLTIHHQGSFLKHDFHNEKERNDSRNSKARLQMVKTIWASVMSRKRKKLLALDPKEWKVLNGHPTGIPCL